MFELEIQDLLSLVEFPYPFDISDEDETILKKRNGLELTPELLS
jgi:hypothetical protein